MGELKAAWVCKSPHCTQPCVKQSILINISCNENLLIRKKLKLFCFPRGSQTPCFCFFWYLYVWCHFLGDRLGKMETKHLVIMGHKETASLFCLELMIVWAKQGQMCWKVQKLWDPQTIWHGCSHLSPFTNLLLCTFYLAPFTPSTPNKPTQLIDREGESSTSQYHIALYLTAFIILSFWIISSDGLARMTDTFLRVEQLQPGSPACPGKPCFTPCQTGEGRPSVWPRGCTNTA